MCKWNSTYQKKLNGSIIYFKYNACETNSKLCLIASVSQTEYWIFFRNVSENNFFFVLRGPRQPPVGSPARGWLGEKCFKRRCESSKFFSKPSKNLFYMYINGSWERSWHIMHFYYPIYVKGVSNETRWRTRIVLSVILLISQQTSNRRFNGFQWHFGSACSYKLVQPRTYMCWYGLHFDWQIEPSSQWNSLNQFILGWSLNATCARRTTDVNKNIFFSGVFRTAKVKLNVCCLKKWAPKR